MMIAPENLSLFARASAAVQRQLAIIQHRIVAMLAGNYAGTSRTLL